jgi:hypothetical protein
VVLSTCTTILATCRVKRARGAHLCVRKKLQLKQYGKDSFRRDNQLPTVYPIELTIIFILILYLSVLFCFRRSSCKWTRDCSRLCSRSFLPKITSEHWLFQTIFSITKSTKNPKSSVGKVGTRTSCIIIITTYQQEREEQLYIWYELVLKNIEWSTIHLEWLFWFDHHKPKVWQHHHFLSSVVKSFITCHKIGYGYSLICVSNDNAIHHPTFITKSFWNHVGYCWYGHALPILRAICWHGFVFRR